MFSLKNGSWTNFGGLSKTLLRPDSLIEVRTWKGCNLNFFEEQKELDIILGCFLDPVFGFECAGEVMPELWADEGWLIHWSKMLL